MVRPASARLAADYRVRSVDGESSAQEAMPELSAGRLLFRETAMGVEVLLVHPGGPFWARTDVGAWSIPKGEFEGSEERRLHRTGHASPTARAQLNSSGGTTLGVRRAAEAWVGGHVRGLVKPRAPHSSGESHSSAGSPMASRWRSRGAGKRTTAPR